MVAPPRNCHYSGLPPITKGSLWSCASLRSPEMVEDDVVEIQEGRHPVIDLLMEGSQFVANDTKLSVRCV